MEDFISFNPRKFMEAIESTIASTFDAKIANIKEITEKTYKDKKFLTEKETAKYLDLKVTTVQELRRDGVLKAKKRGRKAYFHIDEIHRYINEGED